MRATLKESISGWASLHACGLTLINLVVTGALLSGLSATSRSYDFGAGLVSFFLVAALLTICLPLFLLCLALGLYGAYQRETLGYLALLLTLAPFAFFVYGRILDPLLFDTPDRRARQEQRTAEFLRKRALERRDRAARRANGDISISEDSLVVDLVKSPWWVPGCAGLFVSAGAFWVVARRKQSTSAAEQPEGFTPSSAEAVQARCPQCAADVFRVLIAGGSTCWSCGLTLVLSGSSPDLPDPPAVGGIRDLLFAGSFPRRLTALLLVLTSAALGCVFAGLMLAGQWIPAKTAAAYLSVSLGALFLLRWLARVHHW